VALDHADFADRDRPDPPDMRGIFWAVSISTISPLRMVGSIELPSPAVQNRCSGADAVKLRSQEREKTRFCASIGTST